MSGMDQFFKALGLNPQNRAALGKLAKACDIPVERLKYFNEHSIVPSGRELTRICKTGNISEVELLLSMGRVDRKLTKLIQANAADISQLLDVDASNNRASKKEAKPKPVFKTKLGKLFKADCNSAMQTIKDDSVDLIFADPPFNLKKLYPSKIDDDLKASQYLDWCESWLDECVRILKPGGSLFVWNLPKWNSHISGFLNSRLTFRHWIAVDIKYSLPISGRLYPSHYSLLYYTNGDKPTKFHPDRLPMEVCPKCAADLRDYGGYKAKMNPLGVNLTDVWFDIPPVRHAKYKGRKDANELSVKLLDRVIELASDPGDVVFDPFGGAGTTYVVAELKNRRWIGSEIGPISDIENRFKRIEEEREYLDRIRSGCNTLFTQAILKLRHKNGLWTCESVREKERLKAQEENQNSLVF